MRFSYFLLSLSYEFLKEGKFFVALLLIFLQVVFQKININGLVRHLRYFFRWVFRCFSFLSLLRFLFWSFHFRLCFLCFALLPLLFLGWLWSRWFGLCFFFYLSSFVFVFSFLQVVARSPRLFLVSSLDRAN